MEISKSVQEVLTQAQMLKLNTNSNALCVEHILYGLVLMARYLDEPMNKKEYLTEAKKLRKALEKKINSIAIAEQELKAKAYRDPSSFHNDPSVLGRAVEIAGTKAVTTLDLAKAGLEKSDSTISWLNSFEINSDAEEDDARYASKKPAAQKPPQDPGPAIIISGVNNDPNKTQNRTLKVSENCLKLNANVLKMNKNALKKKKSNSGKSANNWMRNERFLKKSRKSILKIKNV